MNNVLVNLNDLKDAIRKNPMIASGLLKAVVKSIEALGMDCYLDCRKQGKKYCTALFVSGSEVAVSSYFDKEREANADLLIKLIDEFGE